MWLRLLYILRQWFCCWFVVDCCSWCGFCVCSMDCYALLCVFSRFALILMLASATSLWEKRLDLKVYVFLLTIPWRCFFCGYFFVTYVSCLSCCLVVYLLRSCGHLLGKGWPLGSLVCGDLLCFITSRWGVLGQMWYLSLSYTYKKYLLILPIFLHKNAKSCITLLAFSDSVSPSSIVYPRRTTFTLVLYLGKTRQRAGIWIKYYYDVIFHGSFVF